MGDKKNPLLPDCHRKEQGVSTNVLNISPLPDNVKYNVEKYFASTYTRFQLQSVAQKIIRSSVADSAPTPRFAFCHRSAYSSIVEVVTNPAKLRSYFQNIVTCGNSLLCPVCARRIANVRGSEVCKAVDSWLSEDTENTCYLLTLTAAHALGDTLQSLLSQFKRALVFFWGHRSIKNHLAASGLIGRITATEIQYSTLNGFHPHQHILIFCRRTAFDLDTLRRLWLQALENSGLSGAWSVALHIEEARSADSYLVKSKVWLEMTFGVLKQGRGDGHFSPMQLLYEVSNGATWAAAKFVELFHSTRGLNLLRWSPGLKKRFGIGDFSDERIASGGAGEALLSFMGIDTPFFRLLAPGERALLLNFAAVGDFMAAVEFVQTRGGVCHFFNE